MSAWDITWSCLAGLAILAAGFGGALRMERLLDKPNDGAENEEGL